MLYLALFMLLIMPLSLILRFFCLLIYHFQQQRTLELTQVCQDNLLHLILLDILKYDNNVTFRKVLLNTANFIVKHVQYHQFK